MKTLEQRVKRLEKETVWYRRATIVFGLLIIAGVTMGQTSSGIVDVPRCRTLEVYNTSGEKTAWISNSNDGGLLGIKNKTGEGIIQLRADEYGNGIVGAYNRQGKGRTLESR